MTKTAEHIQCTNTKTFLSESVIIFFDTSPSSSLNLLHENLFPNENDCPKEIIKGIEYRNLKQEIAEIHNLYKTTTDKTNKSAKNKINAATL